MFHIQTFSFIGTLILSILILAFWWWSTRFLSSQTSTKLSRVLRGIRLLVLLCLMILVTNMSVTWQRNLKIQPKVLLYVDASRSMNNYQTAVAGSVDAILGQLNDTAEIRQFSDQVEPLPGMNRYLSDGLFTNLGMPLENAVSESQSGAVQSAILLSDGAHNSGEQPSSAEVGDQIIPFYTMFIGDSTQYPDVNLEQVQLPRVTYAGDTVTATVTMRASQIQNQVASDIRVNGANQLFARKTTELNPGNYILEEEIELSFQEAGGYQIQFSIDSLSNEQNLSNNTRSVFIQVRPSQYRVLLLAENPSVETRFLAQAIGSMERFELHSHFINMQGRAVEQDDYDIIYTIGSPSNAAEGYTDLTSGIAGAVHQVNTTGQIEKQSANGPALWNESPVVLSTSAENPLIDLFDWETTWQQLPPVWAVRGYQRHLPLLLSTTVREPVIAVDETPQGKYVYIYGQHLWRWNFAASADVVTAESVYAEILETLFYLILRKSEQDQIHLEITDINKGQLAAETQVYDLSGRPVTAARVTGTLLDSLGNPYEQMLFQRDDYSYFTNTAIADAGEYRLIAEAVTGETVLRDTSDTFAISGRDAESTESTGQPGMLRQIADLSGGAFVENTRQLPYDRFNAVEPVLQENVLVWHARKSGWLWGLLTTAFIGDWFIRRRYSLL